jgi:hypothetical protein
MGIGWRLLHDLLWCTFRKGISHMFDRITATSKTAKYWLINMVNHAMDWKWHFDHEGALQCSDDDSPRQSLKTPRYYQHAIVPCWQCTACGHTTSSYVY